MGSLRGPEKPTDSLYLDIRLAWTDDGSTNKFEYIDRIEAVRLGIPYELLSDAVSESGGAANINGHYPMTKEIIGRLRKVGLRP
ncbi:MAG: hypothetical protein MUO26_03130 [Methanotrichaceae archaeon]|nr:hypothetical protein [Methanotrichaceae archaeon]